MLVYEDINKAVWRREEVGKGESEYVVIGKTYEGLNYTEITGFMKNHYNVIDFYYNVILSKGFDGLGNLGYIDDTGRYAVSNKNLIKEFTDNMLYLLKHNPQWLNSSNLTNSEKEEIKELIGNE